MSGGEQAFSKSLLREVEDMFGEKASSVDTSINDQLFTATGLNIGQLDAAVIMDVDAIIGSKKTRLLPQHILQLASTIETIKTHCSSIPQLKPFEGKEIHGEMLSSLSLEVYDMQGNVISCLLLSSCQPVTQKCIVPYLRGHLWRGFTGERR